MTQTKGDEKMAKKRKSCNNCVHFFNCNEPHGDEALGDDGVACPEYQETKGDESMATDNTDEQVKQHYGFQSAQRAYCLSPEPDPLVKKSVDTCEWIEGNECVGGRMVGSAKGPDPLVEKLRAKLDAILDLVSVVPTTDTDVRQAQLIEHLANAIRALEGRCLCPR